MTSNSTNTLWNVWDTQKITIPNTKYTLKGFSIAALRTNFFIPELNIMLDAGISSNFDPTYIFITHAHADHCANIPLSLFSHSKSRKTVFMPKQSSQRLLNYITSLNALTNDCDDGTPSLKYLNLIPVEPKTFHLEIKKSDFIVEVVECFHSVPCVGYGFIEIKSKLNPIYEGKTSKEIQELKKLGITDITIKKDIPQFVFLGDTSNEILESKSLDKYPTIIIECTFILDDDLDQAHKTKHLHWIYLEPYIKNNPNKSFILYHFSQRYKQDEISKFFQSKNLSNVIPWIS